LSRRGGECIDLRALLGRQLGGRRIELGQQADDPEPRRQGNPEPHQQRAQIDALTPSTRQVTTYALEFLAPTQTRRLGSLGNKPLAVVTAGESEPGWLKRQDDLATLTSSNSIHRVVKGATHESLLYDRSYAQATSAAIVEVVAAVRDDQPLAR
jgi:hypothetical protein